MKKSLTCIIILSILFLFSCSLLAETTTSTPAKKIMTTVTPDQLTKLIETQTKTVGDACVLLFDDNYTDYGEEVLITAMVIGELLESENESKFKDRIFDCEDYARFIKANTACLLSQKHSENAIMLGTAFFTIDEESGDGHAVNIFVTNGIVYIYDGQNDLLQTATTYVKAGMKFILIII